MNKAEKLYFQTLNQWRAAADRTHRMICERARREAAKGGLPTKDPMWRLYLHNWVRVPLTCDDPRVYKNYTPKQLKHLKRAICILDKQWKPYRLVDDWAKRRCPHPYFNPDAQDYWEHKTGEADQ